MVVVSICCAHIFSTPWSVCIEEARAIQRSLSAIPDDVSSEGEKYVLNEVNFWLLFLSDAGRQNTSDDIRTFYMDRILGIPDTSPYLIPKSEVDQ